MATKRRKQKASGKRGPQGPTATQAERRAVATLLNRKGTSAPTAGHVYALRILTRAMWHDEDTARQVLELARKLKEEVGA